MIGSAKIIWIGLSLLLVGVAAVSIPALLTKDTNESSNSSSSSTTESEKTEVMLHQVGETIALNQLGTLTIEEAWVSQGDESFKPSTGNVWVNIKAIWQNIGKDDQLIKMHAKHIQDGQGNIYNYTQTDMTAAEPDSSNANFDLDLASGQERVGWLGFEVPENAQDLRLIYAPQQLSNKAIHIELW